MMYKATCQGYRNREGVLEVPEHTYQSERPLINGSHGYCPKCAQKMIRDIEMANEPSELELATAD